VRAEPLPGGGWAPLLAVDRELGAKVEKGEPGHGIEGDARSAGEDTDGHGYCLCTARMSNQAMWRETASVRGGVNFRNEVVNHLCESR